jgi:hypothetical protein
MTQPATDIREKLAAITTLRDDRSQVFGYFWAKEWDGDESDLGNMLVEHTLDNEPPTNQPGWFRLFPEDERLTNRPAILAAWDRMAEEIAAHDAERARLLEVIADLASVIDRKAIYGIDDVIDRCRDTIREAREVRKEGG